MQSITQTISWSVLKSVVLFLDYPDKVSLTAGIQREWKMFPTVLHHLISIHGAIDISKRNGALHGGYQNRLRKTTCLDICTFIQISKHVRFRKHF